MESFAYFGANMSNIKFVDLKAQYDHISEEINAAIYGVIDGSEFIKGKYVEAFENAFAESYSMKYCVGVGNGTDALYLSLRALNIGQGDEVITVANSWVSSAEVICQVGATPVFSDIEPDYLNIDIADVEAKITHATRAIMPVHLYGQPANIEKITELTQQYGLFLIEDCAQAHYARLNNRLVGTYGDISTFSFYPSKNLGAYGDAGAILTNDENLANTIRMLANHGALTKHDHLVPGINSRLDGLQAAILTVKLKYIDQWTDLRIKHANLYNEELQGLKFVKIPMVRPGGKHVFHVYCVLVEMRDKLKSYLSDMGIETAIHYPVALPYMEAYKSYVPPAAEHPVAASYQHSYLSLPLYPELTDSEIRYVAKCIREFYDVEGSLR